MLKEHTFIIIKPDAIENKDVANVRGYIERAGKIIAWRLTKMTEAIAMKFYNEHEGKSFFLPLVDFMSSGPLICAVIEGNESVTRWRELMGPTDPQKAPRYGTVRGDFGTQMPRNAVHGSDSVESAKREINFAIEHGLL